MHVGSDICPRRISSLNCPIAKSKGTPEEISLDLLAPFKKAQGGATQWKFLLRGLRSRWSSLWNEVAKAKTSGSGGKELS